MFYGDMSLPVMAAPPNALPQILSFTNAVLGCHSPVRVTFSVGALDADGTVASIEWFLTGYDGGRAAPTFSGAATNVTFAYPAPGVYTARVEVVDAYKARAWRETIVSVPAATTCTVTVVATGNGGSSLGASSPAALQVPVGATTQIVYTARDWSRIQSLLANSAALEAAVGARTYTQALPGISIDLSNHVTFALATPAQTGYTNVPTAWLTNWAESAIVADPAFTVQDKYLLGLDPTTSNTFSLAVEACTRSGSNVTLVLRRASTGGLSPDGMHGRLVLQITDNLTAEFTNVPATEATGAAVFDGSGRRAYTNSAPGPGPFLRAAIQ